MKKKTYGKTELALTIYPNLSPDRARHKLMDEIHGDTSMMRKLWKLGYKKKQQGFTVKQTNLILEWL